MIISSEIDHESSEIRTVARDAIVLHVLTLYDLITAFHTLYHIVVLVVVMYGSE